MSRFLEAFALIACFVVPVVIGTACEASRAEEDYAGQLDGVREQHEEALLEVSSSQPGLADYMTARRVAELLRQVGNDLARLKPPESVASAHYDLVEAIDSAADVWSSYADLIRNDGSLGARTAAAASVKSASDAAETEFRAACDRIREALDEDLEGAGLLVC